MEKIGKRFCIGDIHGAYIAFKQLLDDVNFDYENDKLICLGDIVDGWSETKECLDLMMTIKNLVFVVGNHDEMALNYYHDTLDVVRNEYNVWIVNGGDTTLKSLGDRDTIEKKYLDFLDTSVYFHVEDENTDSQKLFVHGGVPLACCQEWDGKIVPLEDIHNHAFTWDRDMVKDAYVGRKNEKFKWGTKFETIYVGHTPTISFNEFYKKPQNWGNICLMDTGSAFTGRLTIKDIDTGEEWDTKPCRQLYPDESGRNRLSWNAEKRFG